MNLYVNHHHHHGTTANVQAITELQNWLWINSSVIFQGLKGFTSCPMEMINQTHTTKGTTHTTKENHIEECNFICLTVSMFWNVSKLIYLSIVMWASRLIDWNWWQNTIDSKVNFNSFVIKFAFCDLFGHCINCLPMQ